MMQSATMKICSIVALSLLVVLGIHVAGPVCADGSVSRPLSRAEMSKTFGTQACDCDGVETHTDDCNQPGCPGCSNSSISVCLDEEEGEGNARDVCVTGTSSDEGLCGEDEQIDCHQTHQCSNSGVSSNNMTCSSVSGNCVSGSGYCVECVDSGAYGAMDKVWSYECCVW